MKTLGVAMVLCLAVVFSPCRAWAGDAKLAFKEDGKGAFTFDTGVVKGELNKKSPDTIKNGVTKAGNIGGIKPITFIDPNVPIDNNHGLFVPYRFLTPQKRYGFGSWEWPRTGKLLSSGAVELAWAESPDRPFSFKGTYVWKAANTLDFTVAFTPTINLDKFELFVGSYFKAFTKARVYVKDAGAGKPGFVESPKENGNMQLYPKNDEVMPIIKDGRWTFPPYPNKWSFRPQLAAPLGMKVEPRSGVTVVIMAPPDDCFAISVSAQEGGLGAFYLSLFGKDVRQGQTLTGHGRMIFGKDINDAQAVQEYQEYVRELKK